MLPSDGNSRAGRSEKGSPALHRRTAPAAGRDELRSPEPLANALSRSRKGEEPTARRSRNQNDLECADLSALWHGGTRPAAPGDESPGGKAATSHRTPKSSWRARNRTHRNTEATEFDRRNDHPAGELAALAMTAHPKNFICVHLGSSAVVRMKAEVRDQRPEVGSDCQADRISGRRAHRSRPAHAKVRMSSSAQVRGRRAEGAERGAGRKEG